MCVMHPRWREEGRKEGGDDVRDCEEVDSEASEVDDEWMGEREEGEREMAKHSDFLWHKSYALRLFCTDLAHCTFSKRGHLPFRWTQVHVTVGRSVQRESHNLDIASSCTCHLCGEMGPNVGEQPSSRVPCRSTRRTTIPADTRQDWLLIIDPRWEQRLWVPGMTSIVKKDNQKSF